MSGWSNHVPTPQGKKALDTILMNATQITDLDLKAIVLPYVTAQINSCRADIDHPWSPPAELACATPPDLVDNHHSNFGDVELTSSLGRAKLASMGAQTAVAWCVVILDLDHAGGGGDNEKSWRHPRRGGGGHPPR